MNIERFPGQRDGEMVRLVITKHWIIYLRMMRKFLLFGLVPLLALIFMTSDTTQNIRMTVLTISMIYMSYFILVVFIKWLDEMLDIIIITNQRLISIEQINLFQNTSSETNLPMIQDVKGRKTGIFGNLLAYGDLEVQTAADQIEFKMFDIPSPFTMAKQILIARDETVKEMRKHMHTQSTNDNNTMYPTEFDIN